jgi:hypothetical protein
MASSQSSAVARLNPGGRRRPHLTDAVLDDAPDSSQLEELKAQNEAALNWRESLFHLGSGVLSMLHGFLLPFRACFTSTTWGEYADRPALQYPELANYCVSLSLVDAAFLALRITPLVREHVRRRAARSQGQLRSLTELVEHRTIGAARQAEAEAGDDEEGTPFWRSFRLCLAILEILRRLLAWSPIDLVFLLSNASLRTWTNVSLLRVLRLCHPRGNPVRATYWFLRFQAGFNVGWARIWSYFPMYILLLHLMACGWQAAGTWADDGPGWQDIDMVALGSSWSPATCSSRGAELAPPPSGAPPPDVWCPSQRPAPRPPQRPPQRDRVLCLLTSRAPPRSPQRALESLGGR